MKETVENIVAHSLEKLYREFQKADKCFLDSGMKDMDAHESLSRSQAGIRCYPSTDNRFTPSYVKVFIEKKFFFSYNKNGILLKEGRENAS